MDAFLGVLVANEPTIQGTDWGLAQGSTAERTGAMAAGADVGFHRAHQSWVLPPDSKVERGEDAGVYGWSAERVFE